MDIQIQDNYGLTDKEKTELAKGLEPLVKGYASYPNCKITIGNKQIMGTYISGVNTFTVESCIGQAPVKKAAAKKPAAKKPAPKK